MNIHFSIDDVIQPFRTITYEQPDSVFCEPFFNKLKVLNEKYGAVCTLYAYYMFEDDGFVLGQLQERYWNEIIDSGFIKMGFHGCFSDESNNNKFIEHGKEFYRSVPSELISSTLRLHRYSADSKIIDFLKFKGVKKLLCRDNKTKILYNAKPSYSLSEENWLQVTEGEIFINGITYCQTNIILEHYDINELKEFISNSANDTSVIFTHCKILNNSPEIVYSAFEILSEHNAYFVF